MIANISVWEQRDLDEFFNSIDVPELESIVFEGPWEFVYDRLNAGERSHEEFQRLVNLSNRRNIPLHIVTGGTKDNIPLFDFNDPQYKTIKMHYWDTFWFAYTYYELMRTPNKTHNDKHLKLLTDYAVDLNQEFEFPYITMNNNPKTHRAMLMDELAKHDLIDKGAVSWRDMHNSLADIRSTFEDGITDSMYMGMKFDHWKPRRIFLDQDYVWLNQHQLPPQYKQSFFQIVTESFEHEILFSEKTATPLFFAKPFLILGTKNYNRRLTDLGFVLYDELFDYSFDSMDNLKDRVEGVVQNLIEIMSYSNAKKNQKLGAIRDKLVYNKQLAHKIALDINLFPKPILDVHDYRLRTNTGGDTVIYQLINFIKYANL